MDALILAAGLGTRLKPLTDHTPKPLIEVGGRTMLEWAAGRLIAAGADRLIINLHHHAEQIRSYVEDRGGFGVDVFFSMEEGKPLGTGGGLAAAAEHLSGSAPFFIHNSDIITGIDLEALYRAHGADGEALATLAVGGRVSPRYLMFDEAGLCGWGNDRTETLNLAREPVGVPQNLPFSGVHVVDPALVDQITEQGVFSIITTYMRLAGTGMHIAPYDIGDALWIEIGDPERLARARSWAESFREEVKEEARPG